MANQITPNPSVPSQVVAEVKFPKFINNLGIIPTSYKDSMSYYECLAWLCKYLEETVIPTVNQNGNAVQELQNLYIELNSYVTHYFDTLDVQEEINNKLDEMTTTGELQNIMNNIFRSLENQISALSSGSPAGAYNTFNDLVDANPNHSRIYVVLTNGNWYYWNDTQNTWVSGGVYQTPVTSSDINALINYSPKMAKYIQNNTIILNKTDTQFEVSTKYNTNTYIFSENSFLNVTPTILNTSFPLSDYNINSGTWFLYISAGNPNTINLVSSSQARTWKPNDIILSIIRPSDITTIAQNNLIFDDVDIGISTKYNGFNFPISNYNQINVANDETNKNFTITTNGQVPILTKKGWYAIPANLNTTLSYDFETTSNFISVILESYSNTLKVVEMPSFSNLKDTLKPSNSYNLKYGDIILFTYHKTLGKIWPYLNEFYYNGVLISDEKYENEISNLQTQINLIENKSMYDFLRCFKNFTFIGDSLSAGYTSVNGHTINSTTAKSQNNNWPSYLCSRLNREFTNLAQGNSTIENWRYANQSGVPDTNIERANITTGIYFVSLGVNDLRQNLTIGSASDINSTDYTQNSNSVYGNYDYIINKLKEYNPYAKIFTFTIPNSENGANEYNQAIRYVSNLYDNVYCIDLYSLYDFSTGFIANNLTNGHYNPITYNYISLLIESAINNYIFNNYSNFNLVPYNY